jgi:hypothetical protein
LEVLAKPAQLSWWIVWSQLSGHTRSMAGHAS